MTTQGTRSDFISNTRQAATNILNALDRLNELRAQWDSGMNIWLTEADFVGLDGITKDDITAVVGTTCDNFNTLLEAGNRTNLEQIRAG